MDVLVRDVERLPHAVGGAVGPSLVDRHVRGPHEQQLSLFGGPSLLKGVLRQEATGGYSGLVVVGAEGHASGVGSVVGDAWNPGVVEDAGDQFFGAGDPVGEDHSVDLLSDQQVGALHGPLLVVGVVAVDDLHAHLGGDGVDVVGDAVGKWNSRQSVTVTDLPWLFGRADHGFVGAGRRLWLLLHYLIFGGLFNRGGRGLRGGGGARSLILVSPAGGHQ